MAMHNDSDKKIDKLGFPCGWYLYDISEKDWWMFETEYVDNVIIAKIIKATGAKQWTVEAGTGRTPNFKGKWVLLVNLK